MTPRRASRTVAASRPVWRTATATAWSGWARMKAVARAWARTTASVSARCASAKARLATSTQHGWPAQMARDVSSVRPAPRLTALAG